MDNRARGGRLLIALMMIGCLLFSAAVAAADADPIRVSSLCEPQSVISEQQVGITIKIYNSSQTDMTEEITLFNPDGISVDKYSGLKAESSVTYTGTWDVTQEQIDKGKIDYYIRYMVDTADGPKETVRTVPVTIQAEAAAPQLTATYSVSPTSAKEGQTVTLSYTLSNTGNVELRNIVVTNEGVTKEKVTAASLSVGEKVTLTDTFTMGSKELVSKPQITYQAAGSTKSLTISDMAKKTITVAENGLDVTLEADNSANVYPGEAVTFTLGLKNSGNTAYTGLSVIASDGTTVASGVELAPGASFSDTFTLSFTGDTAVSVSVSGKDGSGEPVAVASSEVNVTTQDPSRALILDVSAQVEKTTIYSEPAVLRFAVVVKNTGETDATTLTVKEGATTVATIPSLPSGESRTLVFDLQTSIAGQFRFDVTGKDAAGIDKTYSSNVLQVVYVAPTPEPTATPAPTAVPPTPTPVPTATPVPSFGEMLAARVNPVVLYAIAGVLGVLLVGILAVNAVRGAQKRKRLAGAIDTIELSPDVRNHRGVARKEKKKPAAKKADAAESIVPVTELESDAAQERGTLSATPARDALRQAEHEENRRRRARESEPVSTDKTLRVAPIDQRPDFVAQGKVDDSQTRIFSRVTEQQAGEKLEKLTDRKQAGEKADVPEQAGEKGEKPPKKGEKPPKTDEKPPKKGEKPPKTDEKLSKTDEKLPKREEKPAGQDIAAGETIRLERASIDDEIRRREQEIRDVPQGKKRSEIKPMKKKGFLFRKKKDEEDVFEDDEFIDDEDDDLFE